MKKLIILLITVGFFVILAIFAGAIFEKTHPYPKDTKFGVTFSPRHARYLGLDPKKTYLQILDELKVKNLRLPTFWNSIEAKKDMFDFSETDFMLSEAEKREVRVILVVGARQPRWPECHYPSWVKQISVKERQQKTLELIQKVVDRYKNNKSIWAYQVENEPFAWWFGENCDSPDKKFLQTEVDLVKKLDSKKLVVITDSGEWGLWADAIAFGDILGSSVYRKVYNSTLGIYMPYPFPAGYYQLKAALSKKLPNAQNKKVIVSELQAEPWLSGKNLEENIPNKQSEAFSVMDFKNNVEFVKKIGFEENYLWGVEWWYFMEKMGYPQYLDYAKTIF